MKHFPLLPSSSAINFLHGDNVHAAHCQHSFAGLLKYSQADQNRRPRARLALDLYSDLDTALLQNPAESRLGARYPDIARKPDETT